MTPVRRLESVRFRARTRVHAREQILESNPLHVNERVIARFKDELGRLGTGST